MDWIVITTPFTLDIIKHRIIICLYIFWQNEILPNILIIVKWIEFCY